MKNLYIPKGKTLHYETLYCQNIVNDGTLIVDGTLHARSISGKGILKAGTVSVRHVAEMDIECATMNGETMAAERVCAAEIVLSGSATVSCYDTPYPHFPIPRLVFGFSLNQEGKASHCRIGVVADEIPTPETPMYYYPFSNVSRESGSLCVGANTLPIYKKPHKAHNLPAFLLSIPNNMHYYSSSNNKLGLEYRELMEHLKDKDPEYYYSDILIPKKETLGEFIQRA